MWVGKKGSLCRPCYHRSGHDSTQGNYAHSHLWKGRQKPRGCSDLSQHARLGGAQLDLSSLGFFICKINTSATGCEELTQWRRP